MNILILPIPRLYRIFSLLTHIYEYSLLNNSISSKETIMYNSWKFQELNFIILRLRMNLSYNDTNIPKILHFGWKYAQNPRYRGYLCVQNGF